MTRGGDAAVVAPLVPWVLWRRRYLRRRASRVCLGGA